jgi:hypothetical protein
LDFVFHGKPRVNGKEGFFVAFGVLVSYRMADALIVEGVVLASVLGPIGGSDLFDIIKFGCILRTDEVGVDIDSLDLISGELGEPSELFG